MILFLTTLAQAAPEADPTISGAWALKLVAGIFTGLGILFTAVWAAYKRGQVNPAHETTLKAPLPEVTTRPAAVFIVRSEFDELKADMEKNFDELKKAMAEERRIAREAQGRVHSRSDANAVALAELKGEVHGMSKNVERLLTLATTKSPRGGS